MQSTIKTPVTVGTFFVTYSDGCPNGTHKHLFFGKPTKKEMKDSFEKCFNGNSIKKVIVVDVERTNLEIDFTSAFLNKTISDFIEEHAHNTLDFESVIIH